jgi:hypothetical protein
MKFTLKFTACGLIVLQDRRVRLYDTNHCWKVRKDVTTRMTRWTITDTALSPDQRLLVYSSISPVAFVVNVGSNTWDLVSPGGPGGGRGGRFQRPVLQLCFDRLCDL